MKIERMDTAEVKAASNKTRLAKATIALVLAFMMPFYAALLVYLLWNWFAVAVTHESISYGQAVGLLLLIYVLSLIFSHDLEREDQWMGTRVVLEACVPEDKKPLTANAIRKIEERNLLLGADMRRFVRCTLAALAGWLVHVFLT